MDEEAPLLENTENDRPTDSQLNRLVKEPLTPLTRVLSILVLLLLLLTSILLGFSIGLEQKLAKAPEGGTITTTWTATRTVTAIPTSSSIPPPQPTEAPHEDDPVCLRPECVLLAASIIDGLDTTKDPCQDFYEFTNGKWLQNNPLPAARERFGTFDQLQIHNNLLLERILTEDNKEILPPDSETLGKLQKFYRSCLDEPRLNTLGHQPLMELVNTITKMYNSSNLAGASALPQLVFKDNSRQGLTAALAYLHSIGINALFEFTFDGDAAVDPNAMTLWLSQPGLGLNAKEYYQDADMLNLYVSTLTRIFEVIEKKKPQVSQSDSHGSQRHFWPPFPWPPWGDDDDTPPKKTPQELAESVVDFETRIAEASLDLVSLQLDPIRTYNPVSPEELADLILQIDFDAYWSSFAPRSYPSKVIVTSKDYLTSLSKLLSNTSSDVIEAYLITRTSLTLAEYLGPETEIWKAHRSLIETLTGISKGAVEKREEYCMAQATDANALGWAAGRFFVLEAFNQESQKDARNIMSNIIHSFKESVLNLDWMDETSAKAAAEKASNIYVAIGYPTTPNTTSATSIAKYYSKLTINETEFFDNIVNSWTFSTTQNWQLLGTQRDYGRFQYMSPHVVNAYLDPLANMIVLPAGIIQPPFYQLSWPGYMKYGAFGAVASHELTVRRELSMNNISLYIGQTKHAFDSSGRFYDQNAMLREWWSNETSEAFEERRTCLSQQYSSYTVDDGKGGVIHLNGNLTSGEDIGDTGFVQAYRAWKAQYVDSYKKGQEYLLPGLDNFTREQLFFIAFAKVWADNLTSKAALNSILTNPHSLNRYRTLGTLVNIPEFAEAFQCPVGSEYNPPDETRCKFW